MDAPMNKKFLLLFFLPILLFSAPYQIVFVHIGPSLPNYLPISLEQARLFNPGADLYLIANQEPLGKIDKGLVNKLKLKKVSCESLKKSGHHSEFLRKSTVDTTFRKGFWRFAIERFFYLNSLIKKERLNNVFHLESDVMLYVNLFDLLPAFTKNYKGIAATFDNDSRCIPGFVYIQNANAIDSLTRFLAQTASSGNHDMQAIGKYWQISPSEKIDALPILPAEYAKKHALVSPANHRTNRPEKYTNHFDDFSSVFDAAAIGQYLGGCDPFHNQGPGFINESSLFNPSRCEYRWERDQLQRLVPYLFIEGKKYRINNLHIHCKNLAKFSSLRNTP
jgi:hypothetical protein